MNPSEKAMQVAEAIQKRCTASAMEEGDIQFDDLYLKSCAELIDTALAEARAEGRGETTDAKSYGTGFTKDGKHVPCEDVFIQPNPIEMALYNFIGEALFIIKTDSFDKNKLHKLVIEARSALKSTAKQGHDNV